MYIYWKPLLFLGFLFWIALLSTDIFRSKVMIEPFLRAPSPLHISTNTEKSTIVNKKSQQIEASSVIASPSEETSYENYGLHVLFANIIIFIFSIVLCSIAKLVATLISKILRQSEQIQDAKTIEEKRNTKYVPPKIQIGDHSSGPTTLPMISELTITDIKKPTLQTISQQLSVEKTSQICQTLFHNSTNKQDSALKLECAKLKDEIASLHCNSLKEHALLSRKLESMAKEKKELSKRLLMVQKENQGAKEQLEELLNERKMLQLRLDNANKNYKFNIKTKRVAMAKLEEISVTVNELKSQLEQATRDKEILQGKFEVLRGEYEQLQDRLRLMQLKDAGRMSEERTMALEVEKAERDDNNNSLMKLCGENSQDSSRLNLLQNGSKIKESVFIPYIISQTEIDMRNIQMKICKLERSLENFGRIKEDEEGGKLLSDESHTPVHEQPSSRESDNSDSTSVPKVDPKNDHETYCNKAYDEIKVEVLRSALREKIKILENMREKGNPITCDNSETPGTTGEEESEIALDVVNKTAPPKAVSNSLAFRTFLRNIGAESKAISSDGRAIKAEELK